MGSSQRHLRGFLMWGGGQKGSQLQRKESGLGGMGFGILEVSAGPAYSSVLFVNHLLF